MATRIQHTFLTGGLIVLLLVAAQLPALYAQGLGQPLNTNGSFEDTEVGPVTDLEDGIEGWVIELLGGAEADFEIVDDSSHVQHGERALKIVPTTLGPDPWSIQAVGDSIPVEPQVPHRLTLWAKAETPGTMINITVGNYAFNEYGAIRPANLTDEWQEFTLNFTVTDGQEWIRAPIHFNETGNANVPIYIDNLQIINLEHLDIIARPIVIESDSGVVGADFDILEEEGVTYVSISNDWVGLDPMPDGAGSRPLSEGHVITYEVTFPAPGEYNLFIRGRVGPDEWDADSFLYPEGFGEKDFEDVDDWRIGNGFAVGGYTAPTDVVTGAGTAGIEVWKWINISEGNFHVEGITFTVGADSLTQTFQIGGRETGFDIDKIAFGRADLYYTVQNLDNVEPGSTEIQPPDIFIYEGPPLAEGLDKILGNIYSPPQVPTTPPLFQSYWNQVTPENAGKWGSVAGGGTTPDPATWNWGALDIAYALAKDNGWPFRFHVLVWGSQQPPWIADLPQEEQLEAVQAWFEAVAERYPDIDQIEVVNEPGFANPSYMNALGGSGETGWDWIITAFEMAREIFPETTELMINHFGILSGGGGLTQHLNIIGLLQERDLIDAIGVQGHHFTMQNITPATLTNSLNQLAATGLPVYVTEYDAAGRPTGSEDVDDPDYPQDVSDANQLEVYQRTIPIIWEHPGVQGITLWGWRLGGWRPGRQMHLVRADGSERPALTWLREYITGSLVSVDEADEIPQEFRLSYNYPNPFNPSTTIQFTVPEASNVTLKVYDVLGRHIQTLHDEYTMPGQYSVIFDAHSLSSGMYLYRIDAGSFTEVKRMMLMK
jgi:endo-1,4-beta-xylanase